MADEKPIGYDFDGYSELTTAIRDLLNQYPRLRDGEEIAFATLGETAGKAMFPAESAAILTERESVTGKVTQQCKYPFHVLFRTFGLSDDGKAYVKEWLDDLGRWLEGQTIMVDGEPKALAEYPLLSGGREIQKFQRVSAGYLDTINDNQSENWAISIAAHYKNEYQR